MVLTTLSSHMGFIIILNQPAVITVGIMNVSESSTSDLSNFYRKVQFFKIIL